ncbi:MAG: hypothetical protein H0V82_13460 [Candidatus Protochlamydia sp.]|nr:hypothetical protein [Candidatus Protochlamydia sp.]
MDSNATFWYYFSQFIMENNQLNRKNRKLIQILSLVLLVAALYGAGRLYFHLTGGFRIVHISSNFPFNPEWEVRPLNFNEQDKMNAALNQPYSYLGKGCQSYVFASEDGQYVLKFFKYQRYRLQPWLSYLPPFPALLKYKEEKLEKKWHKLDGFVKSWKLAFDKLQEETALVFVHLNKTDHLKKQVVIYDKIGAQHLVNLDEMEFCVQRRAQMLCETLLEYKMQAANEKTELLIENLLALILSEYSRGLADNDHALMQNTGVVDGRPIHIDVGQFVQNAEVKNMLIAHQELYTKTYKFNIWLNEHYPEAGNILEQKLKGIMGPKYASMQPKFRPR